MEKDENRLSYKVNGVMVKRNCTIPEFLKNVEEFSDSTISIFMQIKPFMKRNPLSIALELAKKYQVILQVTNTWEHFAFKNMFVSNPNISCQII